ncbi:MAG: tannase/feruloyl esterase family alpha/beta hydrolase [Kibdelosporangium sp.]
MPLVLTHPGAEDRVTARVWLHSMGGPADSQAWAAAGTPWADSTRTSPAIDWDRFVVADLWPQVVVAQERNGLKEDPAFDVTTMTYSDYCRAFGQSRRQYNAVIGTDDPDLSAFRAFGGKMITWHGADDLVIPYQGTVDYRARAGR